MPEETPKEPRTCIACEKPIKATARSTNEYCDECNFKRFKMNIEEPNDPISTYVLRPGWKFQISTSKDLFHDADNTVLAFIEYNGKKIDITIHKRTGIEDEFVIAVANCQITAKTMPGEDTGDGLGKITGMFGPRDDTSYDEEEDNEEFDVEEFIDEVSEIDEDSGSDSDPNWYGEPN